MFQLKHAGSKIIAGALRFPLKPYETGFIPAMKKLHALLLALGFGFLGYLIFKIGPGKLWDELLTLGWALPGFIALEFLAEAFHTRGWSYCLSPVYRRLSWFRLFRIRLAGNAINYLTPTAALGGELTKVAFLSAIHNGPEAVTGVLVGRLTNGMAHALFVSCGSIFVIMSAKLPQPVWFAMFTSGGIVVAGVFVFFILQRYGKLGAVLRWLAKRRFAGARLQKIAAQISSIDDALMKFYRERPGDLVPALTWQLIGHATGLLQTWVFLSAVHCAFATKTIAIVWVLGMWFDLLTFAVPLNMGSLEGTRIVAFKAAGLSAVTGMTYGLTLRLAQLSVACFGLANYLLFMKAGGMKKKPSQKTSESMVPVASGRQTV